MSQILVNPRFIPKKSLISVDLHPSCRRVTMLGRSGPTPTGGGQEIQETAHGMGHLGVSSMIRFVKGR